MCRTQAAQLRFTAAPLQLADAIGFGIQLAQWREVEIALQQRRAFAMAGIGMCQQFPDRIADRRAMGVDLQAGALLVVPGHVQVGDPPAGHRGDVGVGVETEVAGVDVDVVDVQQQLAIGFLQYRADEIDLFQLARQARIRRDVLDDQRPLEDVLYHRTRSATRRTDSSLNGSGIRS